MDADNKVNIRPSDVGERAGDSGSSRKDLNPATGRGGRHTEKSTDGTNGQPDNRIQPSLPSALNQRKSGATNRAPMYKFFINRPIVAMVISIIMVIVGLVTMVGLPIAQFPKDRPARNLIQANYVGADAQTIEQSVATPIEQQMSGVDNMNYMYSINANNG